MQIPAVNPFFAYAGNAANGSRTSAAELRSSPAGSVDAAAATAGAGPGAGLGVNLNQQLALTLLQSQSASYDQPSSKNLRAVDAYRQVDIAPRREQLTQMLGIDLYA